MSCAQPSSARMHPCRGPLFSAVLAFLVFLAVFFLAVLLELVPALVSVLVDADSFPLPESLKWGGIEMS